ncbi:hypothetical protein [Stutzerimonas tarimensis]|uniref:Lipoprotein n=1 Tax=Stutzerimonas tarimensis TaxID=1507735 RepID=A0ABV7T3Q3_9GAMM
MKVACIALAALILAGCAASPTDFSEHETQLAAKVRAYPASAVAPGNTVIGPVRSVTCDSGSFSRFPGTEGEGVWLLKLETARLGGNAVVQYSCRTRGFDPASGCRESKRCEGKAARLD